jgi:hypothetical protein
VAEAVVAAANAAVADATANRLRPFFCCDKTMRINPASTDFSDGLGAPQILFPDALLEID